MFGNAGYEVSDAAAARTVEPEAGLQTISVASVADENSAIRPHVVAAPGDASRDLLRGAAEAAVEAMLGGAVRAVEPPNLIEKGSDRCGREDADAIELAAVEEHLADAGEAAHRNAKPTLRREQPAIFAELPAREITRSFGDQDRAGRARSVEIVFQRLAVGTVELDRTSNCGIAARRPVVASVELHRFEDVGAHPSVEPLPGHAFDDRGNDRKIHVAVGEVIVAGTVLEV